MSTNQKVSYIQTGECELIGQENVLIPDGIYQATYLRFETSAMYSRTITGNKAMRKGGKLYIWFRIDPYSEKLDAGADVELYLPYNTSALILPAGIGGKFQMTKKTDYYKDHLRLIGNPERRDRISPNAYRNKLWQVEVGTVKRFDKQRKNATTEPYSVIRKIICVTG